MGKSTSDSPAMGKQEAAMPLASASADDLLAMMAGEEIDRMLADAEIQKPLPEEHATAHDSELRGDPSTISNMVVDGHRSFQPSNHEEDLSHATTPEEKSALHVPSELLEQAALNDDEAARFAAIFATPVDSGVESGVESGDQSHEPVSDVKPVDHNATNAGESAGSSHVPHAVTAKHESKEHSPSTGSEPIHTDAHHGDSPVGDTSAADQAHEHKPAEAELAAVLADAEFQDHEPGLPFYLKPLEWINAPMAALPEAVRSSLGKVGLLTLFNAVAVLLYVIIFRKHKG